MTVLLTLVLTVLVNTGVSPLPVRADDELESLRQQAEQAREELEQATEEYTERQEALEEAQDELVKTLHELQQTEGKIADMRVPLVELAITLYKQPDVGILGFLTSDTIEGDLRAEAHVLKLSYDQEELLEEADALRDEQIELTEQAQELQSQTQLERVELEDDLEELRRQSEESTEALTQELEDRGLSVDAYMAGVECDPSASAKAAGYPNGLLPTESLCELHVDGHYLRADAATDFLRMNQAYIQEFGTDMCVTSSYRDLQNQHRVYAQQPPGYAAVPGTSNHGLGMAVDLCGGVQNQGSAQFNWLEAHSREYGWFHPQWAYSSPFEPWHWEYDPS
ncbi:D-alanyl-D-alanine carboxypeptidase family protein [Thermobifida halotolerans]|uniref:D-alanyl-D-alanine carboxypeptidase family protein n=1 Tax=Thermobifida halotolerans TaxID=483545 RepID=A0A399FU65_9ACTN|nr:M15 family metallopeptidase [Thermobifida halotolerans]UOE19459.1 D-alanyl-D-alanine carboxypeptidase family protein [Thermobifida halotolerans]